MVLLQLDAPGSILKMSSMLTVVIMMMSLDSVELGSRGYGGWTMMIGTMMIMRKMSSGFSRYVKEEEFLCM